MSNQELYEELAQELNDVAQKYIAQGLTLNDALSGIFGWAIGTTIREFGTPPETIGNNVATLASEIIKQAEIKHKSVLARAH
jgi:hypothetical protein